MARNPHGPNTIDYWVKRGIRPQALGMHKRVDSILQLINTLRKENPGLPIKLAGKFAKEAHTRTVAIYEKGKTSEQLENDKIPVNTNLFPEGTFGRRYRYYFQGIYTPTNKGDKDILIRWGFIDSAIRLIGKTLKDLVFKVLRELLSLSPGAMGRGATPEAYDISFRIDRVQRSH